MQYGEPTSLRAHPVVRFGFADLNRSCRRPLLLVLDGGRLSADAMKEIVEIGREARRIKEPVPTERVFDFSLATEAMK
jgi:hypothetical protein